METRVTVVILAAGLGTRMKSRRAKVLHQAGGKDADRAHRGYGAHAGQSRSACSSWWDTRRMRCGSGRGIARRPLHPADRTERDGTRADGGARLAGGPRAGCSWSTTATVRSSPQAVLESLVAHQKPLRCRRHACGRRTRRPHRLRPRHSRQRGRVRRRSSNRKPARRSSLPFARPTSASTVFAPICSGSMSDELQPNNPAREYLPHRHGRDSDPRRPYEVDAYRAENPGELLGINNRVELAAADRRVSRA